MEYKFEVERKIEDAMRVSMVAEELERTGAGSSRGDSIAALVRAHQTAAHAWERVMYEAQRWRDNARNRSIELGRLMESERESDHV